MKTLLKNKSLMTALVMLAALVVMDMLGLKIGASSLDTNKLLTVNALSSALFQFVSMLKIVPPIFLMIGLLDVWVPRETMIKWMGDGSGFVGFSIAFMMGTLTAGPLVAAFPVAMIMLKKGARYANVLFFLMIWASAKLPILFFQATTLGLKYTLVTNTVLIALYLMGALLVERLLGHEEKKKIYGLAEAS